VRFEEVARILADLDLDAVWAEADQRERRVLIENLVEWIKVFPDHLEVKVVGSPSLNVTLREVGLKVPENVGVGGPTRTRTSEASGRVGEYSSSTSGVSGRVTFQ
jgi:hypothetical protein